MDGPAGAATRRAKRFSPGRDSALDGTHARFRYHLYSTIIAAGGTHARFRYHLYSTSIAATSTLQHST